jgi:hypothetical protein
MTRQLRSSAPAEDWTLILVRVGERGRSPSCHGTLMADDKQKTVLGKVWSRPGKRAEANFVTLSYFGTRPV